MLVWRLVYHIQRFVVSRKKNVTEEKLKEITRHNLQSLENMIEYNRENDIHLFRISSDLIPFGSSPVNKLPWQDLFKKDFERIGKKIKESNMRVSFHPGQYTVLNSPSEEIATRAVEDLNYHNKILDCLDVDQKNKIILHIGGAYGDKEAASQRFIERFYQLDASVKERLIVENDDKLYTAEDVLKIAKEARIPMVYDNLHNKVNPSSNAEGDAYWISKASKTWKKEDGKQKIHYSQQAMGKRAGAHTQTIYLETFLDFYTNLSDQTIDIMLEVKDKNLSAVKCINSLRDKEDTKYLEEEWARYKYLILEHSPEVYTQIRELLKDKTNYPVRKFYHLIEEALKEEIEMGHALNAAQHVWGHLKKQATEKETNTFENNIKKYKKGTAKRQTIKNYLFKLAVRYQENYLLQSLYLYL